MALRAVPDHPKFAELKGILKQPKGPVLGWLESVWHFCGRFTPQGNIGKYSDSSIESWVEWDGEPGALIKALIASGWLDLDYKHRLLVHDWAQHADKASKNAIKRTEREFCTPTVRTECAVGGTAYPLPGAVPVPVPGAESGADTACDDGSFSDWAEAKMAAHPNKRNYDFGIKKLVERFATDPAARVKFDRNHALWCQTKRWLDKQGAFAPCMADFLRDHEWEHAPPGAQDSGEDVMEVHERLMAEKRRKTG